MSSLIDPALTAQSAAAGKKVTCIFSAKHARRDGRAHLSRTSRSSSPKHTLRSRATELCYVLSLSHLLDAVAKLREGEVPPFRPRRRAACQAPKKVSQLLSEVEWSRCRGRRPQPPRRRLARLPLTSFLVEFTVENFPPPSLDEALSVTADSGSVDWFRAFAAVCVRRLFDCGRF